MWSETSNVVFKTALPGRGHSSPIVAGSKVWLTTALEEERSLRVLALDEKTGKIVHDVEVFRPPVWQPGHADNSYASPTPVADEERVCVHFGTYGSACLAIADGSILWRASDQPQEHEVGPGSSPILWRDLFLVNCDGVDSQYVLARNKKTGAIVWKRDRRFLADRKPPHKKAFSTPIVVEDAGRPLLISTGAAATTAYDPQTGEQVWFLQHEGYSNVPMPVLGSGFVMVTTGFAQPSLLAVDLSGARGDVLFTHLRWSFQGQVPTNPTPLYLELPPSLPSGPSRHRVFMVADFGIASWLDADFGKLIWRQRLDGRFFASPLWADGYIYVFAHDGRTLVLEPGEEFRLVAENRLLGKVNATPAIAGRAIFLRTDGFLYRLEKEGGG